MNALTNQLLDELNHSSQAEVVGWLTRAVAGEEPRLPLERDETADVGIERVISHLKADTRDQIRAAVVTLLHQWLQADGWPMSEAWPEHKIDSLLSVVSNVCACRDSDAVAAVAVLWDLMQDSVRFDALPIYQQIRVQNTVEKYSDLFPIEGWRSLAGRDAERFGATAFGALARLNLDDALSILPDLPDNPQVVQALRLRSRWLLASLPEATRLEDLNKISQTLNQVRPGLATMLRSSFAQAGARLPSATPTPRFSRVLAILQKDPAPRGALNIEEIAA